MAAQPGKLCLKCAQNCKKNIQGWAKGIQKIKYCEGDSITICVERWLLILNQKKIIDH